MKVDELAPRDHSNTRHEGTKRRERVCNGFVGAGNNRVERRKLVPEVSSHCGGLVIGTSLLASRGSSAILVGVRFQLESVLSPIPTHEFSAGTIKTMASAPTREALQSLYNSMLSTSRSFASYNFRSYFVQRTQHVFKDVLDGRKVPSPERLQAFYDETNKELEVLKRAAVINQLYGGRKLVVETPHELPAAEKYERGDT